MWNKFFLHPGGYSMKEVHNSGYLALSPNMNLFNTLRHIMDEMSVGTELSWPRGIFNSRVKKYIPVEECPNVCFMGGRLASAEGKGMKEGQEQHGAEPVQLSAQPGGENREDGFRAGVEYLRSVDFLSRCGGMVALGDGGSLEEVLK